MSAQFNLGPHVSERLQFGMFPAVNDADYIFLDVATQPNSVAFWEGFHARLRELLARPDYGVVAADDGYLLLKRGAPQGRPARRSSTPSPAAATLARSIRWTCVSATPGVGGLRYASGSRRPTRSDAVLAGAAPVGGGPFVAVYLTDARARSEALLTQLQPANFWYPTSRWQAGETVAVRTLSLPWDPRGEDFGLAVGVLERPRSPGT